MLKDSCIDHRLDVTSKPGKEYYARCGGRFLTASMNVELPRSRASSRIAAASPAMHAHIDALSLDACTSSGKFIN